MFMFRWLFDAVDIQFIMGVAPNIQSWFWSNPAFDFFSDIVNWLAQIDNTTEAPLIQSILLLAT